MSDISTFKRFIEKIPGTTTVYLYEHKLTGIFLVKTTLNTIYRKILDQPEVMFIEEHRAPKEELAVSNLDLSTNKINTVHAEFPSNNGQTLTVSVKENRPDTTDIDFKGRYIATTAASPTQSNHATIMASIIGGGGNSYYEGKGVAWGSLISSANFANLLPEPNAFYQQYNVSVQNHSYGTAIENFYGADAMAYDASVIARPSLVHVFSAGNSGTLSGSTGTYAGISGFANLTGSFKMAKNIITVGHTDSLGTVLAPSSRGPAHDGRLKPDIVAFGEDGSSGAAAIVSGVALVLQQAFREKYGSLPSSDLIRSMLLNSADDVGRTGIDYEAGYGSLNAHKAMRTLQAGRFFNGTVVNGGLQTFNITIPAGIKQLKIMLVWNDPPATVNATRALVNDIDLELRLPATAESWKPSILSSFPHIDSLGTLPASPGRDSLNNVEQISIYNTPAGNYSIDVKGFDVKTASQSFSIAWQIDSIDTFTWLYPTGIDNIRAGDRNLLRWESNFLSGSGQLEYTTNGINWQSISNVNPSLGYYHWNAPVVFSASRLRMRMNARNFDSDTFTISNRMNTFVGFNCPDSFLFYWNSIPGVSNFRVYRLGAKYMEPISTLADTAIVLAKLTNSALHYSVAPVLQTKTGVRSYGFNYTTQGVGCYVKSFNVQVNGNSGELDLELGTTYHIKAITWQKLTPGGFINLQTLNTISGLLYAYVDNAPFYGLNTYRVRIELNNGQVIFSQPETLYFFGNRKFIVYPDPASQSQPFTVLSNSATPVTMHIYNSSGMLVYKKVLSDLVNPIEAGKLSTGLYLLRITDKESGTTTLKLIVQ